MGGCASKDGGGGGGGGGGKGGGGLVVLQGSATYLSKAIKLDGVVTERSNYLAQVQAMFGEMEAGVGADGGDVDQTNLANGMFAVAALEKLDLTSGAAYIMSKREFKGAGGVDIFTQLWAGFVAEKLVTGKAENMVIVDVGSGELKYFAVTTKEGASATKGKYAAYPFEAKEIAKSKELAEQFLTAFEACVTGAGDVAALKTLLASPFAETEYKDWAVKAIGTQAMRTIRDKNAAKAGDVCAAIGVEIIDPATEAGYELSAVSNAFEHATDLPAGAADKKLLGNLAWGNGSCQGTIQSGAKSKGVSIGMGLKAVKKLFEKGVKDGAEVKAKTLAFPNAAVFTAFKDAMQAQVIAECTKLKA